MKVERMLEIELTKREKLNILLNGGNCSNYVNFIKQGDFTYEEKKYILMANLLPYSEIIQKISEYNADSEANELLLINYLCKKYGVCKKDVIQRVDQVNQIYYYIIDLGLKIIKSRSNRKKVS